MINVNDLNNEYYKLGDKIAGIYFSQNKDIMLNNGYGIEDLKQESRLKVYETLINYTTSSPDEIEKIENYDDNERHLWYAKEAYKNKDKVKEAIISKTLIYPPDKPNSELNKLITNWVYNWLNEIKRNCLVGSGTIIYKCTKCKYEKQIVKYKKLKKCPKCDSELKIEGGENLFIDGLNHYYEEKQLNVSETEFINLFEDIKQFCSDEEFHLLNLRFREYFTTYECNKCNIIFTTVGFEIDKKCNNCKSNLYVLKAKQGGTFKEIAEELNLPDKRNIDMKLKRLLKKIKKSVDFL